ncbi:MAG: hypothetical protein J1F40_04520 [Prevotellaceae bacterium]|nr:hypothetical protein [Prevotellaceae bacterium]
MESYVESKAKEALGNIWEGVLESNIQSSLDENSRKIAEFQIDETTYPSQINGKHPQWANNSNPLSSIRANLNAAPIDYLRYNYKGGKISDFGKGIVKERLIEQADSIKNKDRIRQLSEILNNQAMDSARVLSLDKNDAYLQTLLENPSLALVFNSHPELIRLNVEWEGLPIANNAKLLQYWGTIANKEDMLLAKKVRPRHLNELKFSTNSTNDILVSSSNGERLGVISNNYTISPQSIDLLNLHPMPKATYNIGEDNYTTDYVGRVVRVRQHSLAKGKSDIKKGKMKAKDIMLLQSASTQSKPFFIVPVKQRGTESRLNIVPLVMSDYNKKQLKDFEKKKKEVGKKNLYTSVKYKLFYPSAADSQTPEYILIYINDSKYLLSNIPITGNAESVISGLEKRRI